MTTVRCAGALALMVALIAACGAPPSPTGGVATATAAPTATVAAVTPSGSPSPRPPPMVSAKGSITVKEPASGETINGGVVVSGEASVFEANVQYRVVTTSGKILVEGHTTASVGAPQKGTFRADVRFEVPYYGEGGFVEVFERSPKDGTISDIVRVPVNITGAY